jgi:hypothetical protein
MCLQVGRANQYTFRLDTRNQEQFGAQASFARFNALSIFESGAESLSA